MGNFGKKQRISSWSRSEFICNQEKKSMDRTCVKDNSVDHNDHPILVTCSSASKFVPNTKKIFEFPPLLLDLFSENRVIHEIPLKCLFIL